MSSKLKSWFFSTIRNTNSRGKYVNFNDGSEPDEVTFQNLLDTTVLKKADGDYQDQADYVAVNAESNDKFTTADNLPIVENSVDGSITLDITAATTNSEKIKYKINPHFVSDIDQISPDRDTNVFVNPNNLPKVAVEIVGTPIAGQSPLVVGNTITSELDIVNFYETFKLKLNVLTSSFISHSGVLLSTVLNTLRADVDAKVSDAELASEVSILNSSILTKATKVTPSIGLNGNGTKVTVNAEGVVTNVNRANASDLKNDSSVAGSTIKDALNNLNSSLTGDLIATVVPNISTEISDFNAIAGTKHFVDTSAGNIICSLPAVIDSASGDLIMVYKSTSDTNTITVVDTHLSFVLLQHKDNALFHFSDDRWSFVGIASPISQTVTDGITTKSPSEDAVFDAIYAKGLINGTIWVNAYTALGDFNLSIDKYNNVGYTDAEGPISVILPTFNSTMSGKTIIVEPHRFNSGLTTVDISIPGLQVDGGGGAGTYTEVITKMGQIVTIQANYYGWHVIGHTNQVPDISFKLDLDGGNANQDIDIDGFGVNAKHVKINGTGGAGHIGLKHQSANISASASESSIGADSVGDPVWKNDGGPIDKLELQSNKTSTVTGNEASTTKYLTVKGVYDWAVGLFANISTIPNYYRVDLNNGNDLTGVPGREDKPYKLIQTVWDLIPVSSTAQITIEIVGDYTFTTHALLTSVNKDNITFLFKGKITYAVTASTTSRPLFTFSGTNNNLTFIVPNYSQTTQGGFILASNASGFRYVFDNMQMLLGVNGNLNNNYGFYLSGGAVESYFQCNSLTISLTNDASGIKGYAYPMQIANCNYRINTLKITGTASVASTEVFIFYDIVKSINIENLIANNTYTNITNYNITHSALTCDNVYINNINISAGGRTTIVPYYTLFHGTIKNLTIMSGSILNYSGIAVSTTSIIDNINLGNLTINGSLMGGYFTKNINLLGNITKVGAIEINSFIIGLGQNGQINGNGFKIYHADPVYIGTASVIMVYGSVSSPKAQFINNLTIYNTNIATGSTQAFVPIMYYWTFPITLRFRNLVVSSNLDTNTHADTSFIRPYGANTAYICRIEGNVATNYVKNITNLTNDADIDLINGYTL